MKKSDAISKINAMTGVQKLSTIINLLLSIDNFKEDTLDKLNFSMDYTEGTPLDEIYVDLTYQRKLKIQEILNILINSAGFDKDAAGHIDLAVRNDMRKFVWDGFHRAIMAALCGITKIPTSDFTRPKDSTPEEMVKKEASLFERRNGVRKAVSPAELFKAQVVAQQPEALEILEVLKKAKLNVEKIIDDKDFYDLGGFAFFKKHYKTFEERHLVDASAYIKKAFPNTKNCSVILLIGLTALLEANSSDESTKSASHTEISNKFVEISVKAKQKDFITPRLQGKNPQSVAWNLLKAGLGDCYNDNGEEVRSLLLTLGLDDDELEQLEELS